MVGPTVTMRGRLQRSEVDDLMARCRVLLFPGEEDFGLTPLAAMASGRPVIAYGAGGALETVVKGVTGTFFDAQTAESVVRALAGFDASHYAAARIRTHAAMFDRACFEEQLQVALHGGPHP